MWLSSLHVLCLPLYFGSIINAASLRNWSCPWYKGSVWLVWHLRLGWLTLLTRPDSTTWKIYAVFLYGFTCKTTQPAALGALKQTQQSRSVCTVLCSSRRAVSPLAILLQRTGRAWQRRVCRNGIAAKVPLAIQHGFVNNKRLHLLIRNILPQSKNPRAIRHHRDEKKTEGCRFQRRVRWPGR